MPDEPAHFEPDVRWVCAPGESEVRERDRLVEESRLAVVGDHEAIPAPPLGDELPQGRQPTTVERVGIFISIGTSPTSRST